jgi:hypothetical protein
MWIGFEHRKNPEKSLWQKAVTFSADSHIENPVMTAAAKSVCYFGFYLYGVAIVLIFFPNLLLGMMGMPETTEVWIRILGLLTGIIGYYYHRNGTANNRIFFPFTVHARVVVFLSFVVFVALKMASPMLIGFGVVDLLGAVWTWRALRREANAGLK